MEVEQQALSLTNPQPHSDTCHIDAYTHPKNTPRYAHADIEDTMFLHMYAYTLDTFYVHTNTNTSEE